MKKKIQVSHHYDDVIGLPRHSSQRRPHMPVADRAAQFAPFAALTGYEGAIRETGRLTQARVELDDSRKEELDRDLREMEMHLEQRPQVLVTWFRPDERKHGGAYVYSGGRAKKLDRFHSLLILEDQTTIPIGQIYELEWFTRSKKKLRPV